jgi:glycolate oxidase FAD binding subunit
VALCLRKMGMSEIAARLSDAFKGDGEIKPWAAVDIRQQQAIMSAIALDSPPACLALPSTAAELSQVMAIASAHNWRVLPMGQGSKLSWGGLAEGIDIVVSTARLNRLVEHAVGDFTVTVEPGLKVADLQRILAEQRQFLAVDPAFGKQATVGGLVATADTGSLRQRYGGLRDMLIGIQFARYDGELARAGGRVVKNVAGYDLMKLLTGSYGSLGILSELTFRLYPMQAYSRSLILSGPSLAIEAATAEVRLSGLTPVALDVLSASVAEKLKAEASTTLSLRHSRTMPEAERSRSLVARFQGIEAGVEEQTARLKKIATTHSMGFAQLEGAADEAFWQQSAQVLQADTLLCKVGLRPSGIPWLIELADKVMPGAQVRLYGSSGLGWIQVDIAELAEASVVSGLEELRSHCQKNAGFLTLLQAPKTIKQSIDVWGYSGNALNVMSDIKQKFDPQRRLSPGRFVGQL